MRGKHTFEKKGNINMKKRRKQRKSKKGLVTAVLVILISGGGLYGVADYLDSQGIPVKEAIGQITDLLEKESVITAESVAEGEMKVTFLDVGQGDCTIIQTENGNMMIDAGNNSWGETVVDVLEERGIGSLDYLILTHPDADHIGGADNVLREIQVEKVLMPDVQNDTITYQEVEDLITAEQIPVEHPYAGAEYVLGDAVFTVLCPEENGVSAEDLNASSVGIKLVHGENSFVMCGDAEEQAENAMAERFGDGLECDVLKCGHHGSSTATTAEFLAAADPTWAVISCGKDNSYGHPHAEVLAALDDADVQVYRTDRQGTITCVSDGKGLNWKADSKIL